MAGRAGDGTLDPELDSGLGLQPWAEQGLFLLRRFSELTEQDVSFLVPPNPW